MSKKLKIRKPTLREVRDFLIDNVIWIAGGAIYAAAINMFAVPNQIALSGISGVAIVVNFLTGFPIGATNFLINLPLLILAWLFVGHRFVIKTLWVVSIMSVELDYLAKFMPAYEGDRLLAAIFCGMISGFGLVLILMRGATSGGTDIIGKLVRVRWPHISMGKVIFAADAFVVALSAWVFGSYESAMYAAVVIFISTSVIDYVLYGMDNGKLLMIVTEKANEISRAVIQDVARGVSIIPITGGYTGQNKNMLLVAVRRNEVAKVNKVVRRIDDNAFTIISEVGEILGEGFKTRDHY
jgi:uncharacterized membrane-anchored protein YitT (DUF2179 family)